MKKIFLTLALLIAMTASAQFKIGDNQEVLNSNSLLELESTTKGVMFPRVALTGTANFAPLTAHVAGMTVFNTATIGDVTPGMYTNDGAKWVKLGASSTSEDLNVTTEQTGDYTALATDDIILMNPAGVQILTLPISGISIGKKYYVSVIGINSVQTSPLPREGSTQTLWGTIGYTLMYIGNGTYSVISGQ